MANFLAAQTLVDGPRNTVVKVVSILDTSDLALTPVIQPGFNWQSNDGTIKNSKVRIKELNYVIEDGLTVNLYWNATVPILIETLNGRGRIDASKFGGLLNNAGAGNTGEIAISTEGWAATNVKSFSLQFEMIKQNA